MKRLTISCVLLGCLLSSMPALANPRRWAVIVGSNSAVLGRGTLRYAHTDAKTMASVIGELGGFEEQDIRLLLDPRPEELLAVLDAFLSKASGSEDSLLFFYYSGHADELALYPDGAPLPVTEVRKRLIDPRARVRVGIVDACRGGGWTGAKGLAVGPPFEVETRSTPENEGTVLISSSSGDQSAHEAEALAGSFFTHHFVAAMRGAADEDADGGVALTEAFGYARRRTVRDAALYAKGDQNPSFSVDMIGRHDLVLTRLERAKSRLIIEAHAEPLDIVNLESGATIAEAPPTERAQALAVGGGTYLVRGQGANGEVLGGEFVVKGGEPTHVKQSDLRRIQPGILAEKAVPSASQVEPELRPAAVVTEQKKVKVMLLPDRKLGSTFYLKSGHAIMGQLAVAGNVGGLTAVDYGRLCTAPCEVALPPGDHTFGVMKQLGTEVVPMDPIQIVDDQKLRVEYDDRAPWRTGAVVLGVASAIVGGGLAIAGAVSFVREDDTNGGVIFGAGIGTVIAGGGAAIFMYGAMGSDRAKLHAEE